MHHGTARRLVPPLFVLRETSRRDVTENREHVNDSLRIQLCKPIQGNTWSHHEQILSHHQQILHGMIVRHTCSGHHLKEVVHTFVQQNCDRTSGPV